MNKDKKRRLIKIVFAIIAAAAIILLSIIAFPLVKYANEPDKFAEYIDSFGASRHTIMSLIQLAQIIVALVPGEVIEFVAGTVYGWLGGFIFCMAGIILGHTIIFKSVRYFGKGFVEAVAGSKIMEKFEFLQNENKLHLLLFFLFFIPGTPKDLLTYIVPLTKIKFKDFIVITTIARIPSVISSTFAGHAFSEQNYKMLIMAYILISLFTIIGFVIYKFVDKKLELKRKIS